MTVVFVGGDGAAPADDAGDEPCGQHDPLCHHFVLGPAHDAAFPLPGDPGLDAVVAADSVTRDDHGWLVGDTAQPALYFVWLARDQEGTVSKVDARTMKEVARYRTTTCFSLPSGSRLPCDGTNGCCAADSLPQWQNRRNKLPGGPAQQVQGDNNSPSRTAIDFNGDLFVANRAFGGQASITKIANELAGCKDRNKNGRIETSSDVNLDGRIDANDPREFLDLDDECIQWTTNHGASGSTGRPLGLGPGAVDNGPSDAFAGGYETGVFYRIDGTTGKTKDEWQLPEGCRPYGLAIDSQGFGWAPNDGLGPLCYFDTRKNTGVGRARGEMIGYGVAVDRDQNVWVGGGVARYTPDRSKGFETIGNGSWTRIDGLSGKGIAADSRNAKKHFVWSASTNGIVRIPASEIPLTKGMDTIVALDPKWPKIDVESYGLAVDADQNVIAAPQSGIVTRTRVDQNGDFLPPDVTSPPKNGLKCPAGDRCDLGSHLYAYSDFADARIIRCFFGSPTWSYVIRGCVGPAMSTQWYKATWEADAPPNTRLTMRVRSGPTPKPDASWGSWTPDFAIAPVDLWSPDTVGLWPNGPLRDDADYLEVEFAFRSNDRSVNPKLKSLDVAYRCEAP